MTAEPLVRVMGISKTFGFTHALVDVSLEVLPGEVHALVGQNGSGKSTLIKILAGYHTQEPGGRVEVRGPRNESPEVLDDRTRANLAFLHQDLGIAPNLSVTENLLVGDYDVGAVWRINWRKEDLRARKLLARFGLDIDTTMPARLLSRSEQAIVGIARAFARLDRAGGGVLVLDEPTAVLPDSGLQQLYQAIRAVVAGGSSVLLVSHRLNEVRTIADRVSILRDGRLVATVPAGSTDTEQLIALIFGHGVAASSSKDALKKLGAPILELHGLTGSTLAGLSCTIRQGEVVGITGLMGMGQDEVPYLLMGAAAPVDGWIELDGNRLDLRSPTEARARGIALVPEDRQRRGAFGLASLTENITASVVPTFFSRGRLHQRLERTWVENLIPTYGINPPEPDRILQAFSGGNQQKAILARAMESNAKVLVLHEPTQGVDVASRRQIIENVHRRAASKELAVVVVTVEYADLVELCDRVLVVQHGQVVSELAGADLTEGNIARACHQYPAPAA